MSTNVSVYDLENYPDNGKTVTTDQTTVVPVGAQGDERWVLSFVTSAYSDNTSTTSIQDIYVQESKAGWAKSSGLVSAPFVISSANKTLGVKIDNSSKWYYVQITVASYGGDSLADELEIQIRDIPNTNLWNSSDDSLAYKNAVVEYNNSKFYIVSGNIGEFYTGTNRSSVKVTSSGIDTFHDNIGFNLGYDSQTIASITISETTLASTYTGGTSPISISADIGATAGDAMMITNGTTTEYFTVLSGTATSLEVAMIDPHTFDAISSTYSGIGGNSVSKVQRLREQDPDQTPVSYYNTVDDITRWGIMSTTNQIDFSS